MSAFKESISFQRLSGQDSYLQWSRDFKVVAEGKGVIGLYLGTTPILELPDRSKYFTSFLTTIRTTRSTADASATDLADVQARILEYQLDLQQYEKNDIKNRVAKQLLLESVEPSIRGPLQQFDNVKEAWD